MSKSHKPAHPAHLPLSNHRATTDNLPCPLTSNTLPQYDLSAPEKSGATQNSTTPRDPRTIPPDNTSAHTENAAASAFVCPRGTAIRGTAIRGTAIRGTAIPSTSLGTGLAVVSRASSPCHWKPVLRRVCARHRCRLQPRPIK
jgi:hypothetical protein